MAEKPATALPLDRIRLDGDTQPRAKLDIDTAREYADVLKSGKELPSGIAYHDGSDYWLASGFTRWHAHKLAGRSHMSVQVRQGTLDDARLYAASTNTQHGLRRSHEDKRRAVHIVLRHPQGKDWDSERIAEHCQVSVGLVEAIRLSTPWEETPGLFDGIPVGEPPAPDLANATPAVRAEHGKITKEEFEEEASEEDHAAIEDKVVRLIRKLCRYAKTLGETPEELLQRHLAG